MKTESLKEFSKKIKALAGNKYYSVSAKRWRSGSLEFEAYIADECPESIMHGDSPNEVIRKFTEQRNPPASKITDVQIETE